LFYLGDGEQTAQATVRSFAPIAHYRDGGAVLGYGTTKGAQILKYTGLEGSTTPKTTISTVDPNSTALVPAVSITNPTALQKIASELKVTYRDRNHGGSVGDLFQTSQAQLAIDRSQHVIHYLNLYWLAAIPLAGLIFWEWQALVARLFAMRDRRRSRHV
jgi:Ca-activated chloride channel family protein